MRGFARAGVGMAVVLALVCGTAWAGPYDPVKKYGEWWIQMGGTEQQWLAGEWEFFEDGGGDPSAYRAAAGGNYPPQGMGPWFAYPNENYDPGATPGTPSVAQQNPMPWIPGWHNIWWYDHPFDPNRWKDLWIEFDYMLNPDGAPGTPGLLDIVVNFTTPLWPTGANNPPLPGQMDPAIGRELLGQIVMDPNDPTTTSGHFSGHWNLLEDFDIPFNPEWISVDVAGYNFLISQQEPGSIIHACVDVPEPVSMALLVSGLAGLGAYVRRRRRA